MISAFRTPFKATREDAPEVETGEVETPDETPKGRGVAPRPESRRAKAAPKAKVATTGRTLYLPETLFERIIVQAHRKRMTHSEYVTMMLERVVPDYRGSRADSSDSDAA